MQGDGSTKGSLWTPAAWFQILCLPLPLMRHLMKTEFIACWEMTTRKNKTNQENTSFSILST